MATNDIVIDRSRLSYKDAKRTLILRLKLQKAEQELDIDAIEAALDEMGALVEKSVVSVPASFFVEDAPATARSLAPGWIDWIHQEAFVQLQERAAEASTTGKKAG